MSAREQVETVVVNRENIIRMAREAGMVYRPRIEEFSTPMVDGVHYVELERFAAIVAAAVIVEERTK